MKVLQINSVCGYGSTGRIVVDLYHTLEEHGYDCCVAYGRNSAPKYIEALRIGCKKDIFFHVLKTRFMDKHGFGSKKATQNLLNQIRAWGPDIIHLHNIHGYYINIELLFNYIKEMQIPVIWTLHDCWTFTGHCAHYDNVGCNQWVGGCHNCPQRETYPNSWFHDRSQFNYLQKRELFLGVKDMTIVTPSLWLKHQVEHSFLKYYPVSVIPNGIDLTKFITYRGKKKEKTKLQLLRKYHIRPDQCICLGAASVWTKEKGFDDFLCMGRLTSQCHFILAGVSERQKKKLPANITGISRTNSIQELVDLYNGADVFLNPTYADTYPTVNLEAHACGLPIISYRTGGSTEIADIVVEKGDFRSMVLNAEDSSVKDKIKAEWQLSDKNECYNKYLELYLRRN